MVRERGNSRKGSRASGKTANWKHVNIKMPPELVELIDKCANMLSLDRSKFIRLAVIEYLQKHCQVEVKPRVVARL